MKVYCYLQIFNESRLDYKIILYAYSEDNKMDYIYINYPKNTIFNDEFRRYVYNDENDNLECLISYNINSFTKRLKNGKVDIEFLETELTSDEYDLVQYTFIEELNLYLTLDPVSQEFYSVNENCLKNMDENGIFQSPDNDFLPDIFSWILEELDDETYGN